MAINALIFVISLILQCVTSRPNVQLALKSIYQWVVTKSKSKSRDPTPDTICPNLHIFG